MPTRVPTQPRPTVKRPAKPDPAPEPATRPPEPAARPPAGGSLSHAELLDLARRNPPAAAWFEDDSDPFTPAPPPASE